MKSIKQRAVYKLRNNNMIYIAAILEQMDVQEVQEDCVAYVKNHGGAVIYVGKQFKALNKEHQENILIHEAMHIPQIDLAGGLEQFYNFDKAFEKTDDVDFLSKIGETYEKWRNYANNLGFDAEINEFIKKYIGDLPKEIVYPKTLPKFCETDRTSPAEGEEFFEYVQFAIDELPIPEEDKQQGGSGDSSDANSQGQGQGQGSMVSDLNPDNWGEVARGIVERAEGEVLNHMEKEISYTGKDAGMLKGISEEKLKKGKIPNGLVGKLQKIMQKVRPRYQEGETPCYNWGVKNRAFPTKNFPGMKNVKTKKNVKKLVVVMDSSGSMWCERNFKIMLAIAHWVNDKKMLAGLYCCDTQLSKCALTSSKQRVRGGGGTEFGKRHIEAIVKDTGHDIDILYLTDGALDLTEARSCKDVHLLIMG